MGNIFSKTAPRLDTNFRVIVYIFCYLLFIGVVLAIGFSLCIYIDHRRQTRLSQAILDEERNLSEVKDEKDLPEVKDEKDLPEGKDEKDLSEGEDEKTPLLPASTHQDPNRQFHLGPAFLHTRERKALPAQQQLRRHHPSSSVGKSYEPDIHHRQASQISASFCDTQAAPIPRSFTKCGMRYRELEWNTQGWDNRSQVKEGLCIRAGDEGMRGSML